MEFVSTAWGYKPPGKSAGVSPLPPGNAVAGGTSIAGAPATSVAALLTSAAKRARIHYDAERIRVAVISSARFLPAFQACRQRNSLTQVDAMWKVKPKLDAKRDPLTIEGCAAVETENAQYRNPPFERPGIFERGRWSPSRSGMRAGAFTRTFEQSEPVTFKLEWLRNNRVSEPADSISLSLRVNMIIARTSGKARNRGLNRPRK
jgi:hypothetical protein